MKNVNISYLFAPMAFSLVLPGIILAAPAISSSKCHITAKVERVEKVERNVEGRKSFSYYSLKIHVASSTLYKQENMDDYCDRIADSDQKAIFSVDNYKKTPVSEGQTIKANIYWGGDEWLNGNFLSEVEIIGSKRNFSHWLRFLWIRLF
jgi:hypothetical protein